MRHLARSLALLLVATTVMLFAPRPVFASSSAQEKAVQSVVAAYYKLYLTQPNFPWKTWSQAKPYFTPGVYSKVQAGLSKPTAKTWPDIVGGSTGDKGVANGKLEFGPTKVTGDTATCEVHVMFDYDDPQKHKVVSALKTKVVATLKLQDKKWKIDDLRNWDTGSLRELK